MAQKPIEERLQEVFDACNFRRMTVAVRNIHGVSDMVEISPSELLELHQKNDPRINGLSRTCIIVAKSDRCSTLIEATQELKLNLPRLLASKRHFSTPHEYASWMAQHAKPFTYEEEPKEYLEVRTWHLRASWAVLADLLEEIGL